MDKLILNGTNGFPLHTDTLAEAQRSWNIFNAITGVTGNLAILSGCEVRGSSVTDGVVAIDGEVLPFKGGAIMPNVIIKSEITQREFKDKNRRPVFEKRTAQFGGATQSWAWSDFKRVKTILELQLEKGEKTEVEKLSEKLNKIETRLNKSVPLGLIAVWNKPANIPIPEGWQECTDLRGKMPMGYNSDYSHNGYTEAENYELNVIGATGGELSHKLNKAELPEVSGRFQNLATTGNPGTGVFSTIQSASARIAGNPEPTWLHRITEMKFGEGDYHNNMPPYRVIRFIEFIGFSED